MGNDQDPHTAFLKVLLAWFGGAVGNMTLSSGVLAATLLYTLVQTFFLLRDKWWRERK